MNCDNSPKIGVILVKPDASVEIAYYQVLPDNFPSTDVVLDALVVTLGYVGVTTTTKVDNVTVGPIVCPTDSPEGGR